MATVEVTVCDMCHQMGKQTQTFTIEGAGMLATLDLCPEDAAPLLRLQEAAPKPEVGAGVWGRPRARETFAATTMEEIDALKASGKA